VVFDKTGTLTAGRPEVRAIVPAADAGGEDALLGLASSAQHGSEHPLARAIERAAEARGLATEPVSSVRALAGRGLEATVGGRALLVGSARLMAERGVDVLPLAAEAAALEVEAMTVVWLAEGRRALALFGLADGVRPRAHEAVARLRREGILTVLLTGDNRKTADVVGAMVGVDRVIAEVLPEAKAATVAELRAEGGVVAMVGDGVNDAPALAAADVGFAVGSGTDVAMHAAGITLMRPEPTLVPEALAISRATMRTIRQNLFWAFVYNAVGVPLAVLGWLTPVVAGAAMALSSVSVVANALRLWQWRPGR
jgi:Cu+-exporting ATPase